MLTVKIQTGKIILRDVDGETLERKALGSYRAAKRIVARWVRRYAAVDVARAADILDEYFAHFLPIAR
jgi:hypothetical protein